MGRSASLLAVFLVITSTSAAFESIDDDLKQFRAAIDENLLDDDAYAALVDKLKEKGYLNGDPELFRKTLHKILRSDEIVAHHRLEYALKQKGFSKESQELDPYFIKGAVDNSQ